MKTDTNALDKALLRQSLNNAYGLASEQLTFTPKGEDAYAYLAHGPGNQVYFVRAQPGARRNRSLVDAYKIVHLLREQARFTQAVAPLSAQNGALTLSLGDFVVAVFPYIEGETLWARGATVPDLQQAARLLAQLHESAAILDGCAVPQASFSNPFEETIQSLIAAARKGIDPRGPFAQQAQALFREQAEDLERSLTRFGERGERLKGSRPEFVLIHGDPNLDNFLRAPDGVLHLTDWGEVGLGLPEQDLLAFTGSNFPVFLDSYLPFRPKTSLHPERFEFYFYRWAFQEIADYGPTVLFGQDSPIAQEHAWQELQSYLPLRHGEIAVGVETVRRQLFDMTRILPETR